MNTAKSRTLWAAAKRFPQMSQHVGTSQRLRHSQFRCLLKKTELCTKPSFKISVVGCGQVGITICAFLLAKSLTKNLVLFDPREDWIEAEALDFLHGSRFLGNPVIKSSANPECTENSDVVIITAGVRPSGKDRSRLAVIGKSAEIIKTIVPDLAKVSPKAVFLVVSNPLDVMTAVVQRVGKIEKHRCFGTGCHLDSARFQYLIGERLQVPTSSVGGYMIGEHGASAVPVWSSVTVGGVPLMKIYPNIGKEGDEENWNEISKGVITGGAKVSLVKGYTNWAIALTACDVVEAMLQNSGCILSLATDVKGINCIENNVVLSLPCAVTLKGISHILELPLRDSEQIKLLESAKLLKEAQDSLKL